MQQNKRKNYAIYYTRQKFNLTVKAENDLMKYIIEKGSVALDGISLTVAVVGNDFFKVSIIPHTASETTLLSKNAGDIINIECDIIGKYVEKLMSYQPVQKESRITAGFLAKNGFM